MTLECIYLGYSEHKKAFVLLHHSSGRIIESKDMHFDKSKSIEPNRVKIEMEATENREKMKILPDQEEEDITSSATLSDKLTELKNGNSKQDNDGEQPDRALEREEPTRESSSCTGLQSMSNNVPVHRGKVFKLNQLHQWTQQQKICQKTIPLTILMQRSSLQN